MMLLTACAPSLPQPTIDVAESYIYGDGVVSDAKIDSNWWDVYQDPLLDSLINHALERNRNLIVASSRIESARNSIRAAQAAFLPSANAALKADAEYTTPTGQSNEFELQGSVSWNLSLFGALRNTSMGARAELLSTQWAYRGIRLALTTQVATTYFTLLQYAQSLAIARQSLILRREAATLIDSMLRYGNSTGLDLAQAKSLVYSAEADVDEYTRAVTQTHLSLATLLGEPPQNMANIDLSSITLDSLPPTIPAGVPSDLMYRRPDVMEAYYNLQAAAAKVGVARSNRFPSISLTGSGGLFGTNIKELFTKGYWSWEGGGGIVEPLFNFGRLRRQERIAREAYNQSIAQYEQSVLSALEDVESALVAISTTRQQAERYADFVAANERIALLTDSLYRAGMSNYLDVISTYQTWYESQLTLVGLIAQQYINYADAVMALGEGWQQFEN